MISNLENQCKKYPYRFGLADKNQPTLSFDKKPEGEGNSSSSMIMHRYNAEDLRQAIVEFIIGDEHPFRVVEGCWFRRLLKKFEPRFQMPSRITVARDCFKIYNVERAKLKTSLKSLSSRVCLTTNTWTSN